MNIAAARGQREDRSVEGFWVEPEACKADLQVLKFSLTVVGKLFETPKVSTIIKHHLNVVLNKTE